MFFDTHAHYDDRAFDEDRDVLIRSLTDVAGIINPGCDLKSSLDAKVLAETYDQFYFAAGLHPEEIAERAPDWAEQIAALAAHGKCVAIGEIGLDYYWDSSRKEEQKSVFAVQLEMAIDMNKPVIIHDREAHGDALEAVRKYPTLRGVFHCFSGSREMAEELLKKGFYLGFDGPVTYKNARKTLEVLEICPLDRILIETDSPYLAPVPVRGTRNDSRNLTFIAEKIAEIKQISPERVTEITTENAKACFRI